MSFEGTYLGLTEFTFDFDDDEPGSDDEEAEYVGVEGFGTLNYQ